MDIQLLLIVAIIALVAYQKGFLGNVVVSRNAILAAMAVVVGYYLLNSKGMKAPVAKTPAVKPVDPVPMAAEGFKCGSKHAESFEDEPEEEDVKEVPGNFLDGAAKHANMFEQQTTASLPYMVGTTVAPPEPGPLKRSFLSQDLRPAPTVSIDQNQSIPFGMSSVVAAVAQHKDMRFLSNKEVGVAKCL